MSLTLWKLHNLIFIVFHTISWVVICFEIIYYLNYFFFHPKFLIIAHNNLIKIHFLQKITQSMSRADKNQRILFIYSLIKTLMISISIEQSARVHASFSSGVLRHELEKFNSRTSNICCSYKTGKFPWRNMKISTSSQLTLWKSSLDIKTPEKNSLSNNHQPLRMNKSDKWIWD